jgi:two-component system phosphate regulon response regulator PhoB
MRGTILFADDQRRLREYCKQELEAEGFRVVLAEDGEEALDVLGTLAVDLVILDEHMPRCSGLEAAKRIKERYPSLAIILFTADADYERYKSPLVDAVVIKSEEITALKAAVVQLLPSPRCATTPSGKSELSGLL